MIVFCEEFAVDYQNYRFAYCKFCELESLAELDAAYAAGYLPASNHPFPVSLKFYQARSLRVNLAHLSFNKNRRYQQRLLDNQNCGFEVYAKEDILAHPVWSDELRHNALTWVTARYSQTYLPSDRLDFLLERPFLNKIARAYDAEGTLGYALLCTGRDAVHYWFALYRPHPNPQYSTGKWMMGRFLQWAKSTGFTFAYLGTAYGAKAAYKRQGITGCAFFDGKGWNENMERLEELQFRETKGPDETPNVRPHQT